MVWSAVFGAAVAWSAVVGAARRRTKSATACSMVSAPPGQAAIGMWSPERAGAKAVPARPGASVKVGRAYPRRSARIVP
ncbi:MULTISPECIES: hypothetical protein [Streptomyces]|uniref:Secreted protein n=1 Tax=Streptomyces spinosisporus TaxID=2927582 RepID=A0ABS9XHC5_9ACTN|nr:MULTISPECIES: hypothetical protein [Streptomyces]MCI3240312.1 hypothetical protein [Streptomyces spinosisporus]